MSIQTAQCDLIKVHESQIVDSGAGEHVGGVGSDAAQADDEDVGVGDAFHSVVGGGGEVEGVAGERFGADFVGETLLVG